MELFCGSIDSALEGVNCDTFDSGIDCEVCALTIITDDKIQSIANVMINVVFVLFMFDFM
jgi:hypothetical protein